MSLKPNFNPRSKERPKTMKTITISILLALTACTTIIVEPPNDAGPTPDSFTSMDGSVPDSFTSMDGSVPDSFVEPEDAGPPRFDVGNDATPRDIDIPFAVCDDHFRFIHANEICRHWAEEIVPGLDCEDPNDLAMQCPLPVEFRGCNRCDRDEWDRCLRTAQERRHIPGADVCALTRDIILEGICAYTMCGWYDS